MRHGQVPGGWGWRAVRMGMVMTHHPTPVRTRRPQGIELLLRVDGKSAGGIFGYIGCRDDFGNPYGRLAVTDQEAAAFPRIGPGGGTPKNLDLVSGQMQMLERVFSHGMSSLAVRFPRPHACWAFRR